MAPAADPIDDDEAKGFDTTAAVEVDARLGVAVAVAVVAVEVGRVGD